MSKKHNNCTLPVKLRLYVTCCGNSNFTFLSHDKKKIVCEFKLLTIVRRLLNNNCGLCWNNSLSHDKTIREFQAVDCVVRLINTHTTINVLIVSVSVINYQPSKPTMVITCIHLTAIYILQLIEEGIWLCLGHEIFVPMFS